MYVFTIRTNRKEYTDFDGKQCLIPRNPIRHGEFVEVYIPETRDYILLTPKELED